MSEVRLVRGRWVVTGGAEPVLSDAAIALRGDRIEELGDWPGLRARYPEVEVIGSERAAVLPGLINAHHHSNGAPRCSRASPTSSSNPGS